MFPGDTNSTSYSWNNVYIPVYKYQLMSELLSHSRYQRNIQNYVLEHSEIHKENIMESTWKMLKTFLRGQARSFGIVSGEL
jgi:hypothetical protein